MTIRELILKLLEGKADHIDRKTAYEFIRENTDRRALLELLAEEAAEVSQAALKLIRAEGNGCPTGITQKAAICDLLEEISDLKNVVGVLDLKMSPGFGDEKVARWIHRITVKSNSTVENANTCIMCGAVIPEGKQVCKCCVRKVFGGVYDE